MGDEFTVMLTDRKKNRRKKCALSSSVVYDGEHFRDMELFFLVSEYIFISLCS